jgi:hypothetical protein
MGKSAGTVTKISYTRLSPFNFCAANLICIQAKFTAVKILKFTPLVCISVNGEINTVYGGKFS